MVTEITLRLIPKPLAQATALAAFARLADACEAVGKILASGITPLVTEIMDHDVMRAIADLQHSRSQTAGTFRWKPTRCCSSRWMATRMPWNATSKSLPTCLRKSGATSVQRARSDEEAEALWEIRRSVSPAVIRLGNSRFGEDIVVPRGQIPQMVDADQADCQEVRSDDRGLRSHRRREPAPQHRLRSARCGDDEARRSGLARHL